ncbi:MAG: YeeE/YedE family protein [Betaproteobacteria bacterium]|nr:YeeE/YedE family protein [Betaproteobacteria bacterium]
MRTLASALVAGFLFGIGLWISGMANPKKVLGFLDITGDWDASLLLVMGGAVAVTLVGFHLVLKLPTPWLEKKFLIPGKGPIDTPLVAGAALFGIGWGIAGYCPGPALTALSTLSMESVVFVAAMIVGGKIGAGFIK